MAVAGPFVSTWWNHRETFGHEQFILDTLTHFIGTSVYQKFDGLSFEPDSGQKT